MTGIVGDTVKYDWTEREGFQVNEVFTKTGHQKSLLVTEDYDD